MSDNLPELYVKKEIEKKALNALSNMMEYQELMLYYDSAIKIMEVKLDVINSYYKTRFKRNPIHNITSRRKKTISIIQKLERLNKDISIYNIEHELHDVAGIRVICAYLDDVYEVAKAIIRQEDIELLQEKDYIKNPKANGYRSLHLIVKIPVSFTDMTKDIEVEIQIRTIAMDFWASLEHEVKYKKDLDNDEVIKRLKDCAETIAKTDRDMLAIRKEIENKEEVNRTNDLFDTLEHKDLKKLLSDII